VAEGPLERRGAMRDLALFILAMFGVAAPLFILILIHSF
jgi:hypothetical protein